MGPVGERLSGRAKTEAALEAVALQMLQRDGVLAGLNLKEVAEEAGVNRGLIYQYYGSRRDLARSALRRKAGRTLAEDRGVPPKSRMLVQRIAAISHLPVRARVREYFRIVLGGGDAIRLLAMLVLDGDTTLKALPGLELARETYGRDQAGGSLDPDLDVTDLHVAMASLAFGYSVFRRRFATEVGTTASQLDDRMADIIDRIVAGLHPASVGGQEAR